MCNDKGVKEMLIAFLDKVYKDLKYDKDRLVGKKELRRKKTRGTGVCVFSPQHETIPH